MVAISRPNKRQPTTQAKALERALQPAREICLQKRDSPIIDSSQRAFERQLLSRTTKELPHKRNGDELAPAGSFKSHIHKDDKVKKTSSRKIWNGGAVRNVRLGLSLALLVVAIATTSSAQDHDILAFQGGIGVINVIGQNADSTVRLNMVRGVTPGAPWVISSLTAVVKSDGHISVVGRGLLLSAGDGIGTNAGASVHATLFCGAADSATAFDEPGVALDAAGNFKINDVLTPVPQFPCESPVLLIRSGAEPGHGVWFAAGIPSSGLSHAAN